MEERLTIAGDAIRGAARDLARATRLGLERRRAMLTAEAVRLDGLSPLATLARGYAVARNDAGDTLGSVSQFAAGDRFDLLLRDGSVRASVLDARRGAPLEQDGAA
jgi:exodeoxyribonuclease VII large subunit